TTVTLNNSIVAVELADANILVQAMNRLQPQTGLSAATQGVVSCNEVSSGWNPAGATSSCTVTVDGLSETLDNVETLVESFKAIQPMTGPAYSVEASFTVTAETEVSVGKSIAAQGILDAAQFLLPRTGTNLQVEGNVQCWVEEYYFGPYETCYITIDGLTTYTVYAAQLVEQVQLIKPVSGNDVNYTFEATFSGEYQPDYYNPAFVGDTVFIKYF
ncbi:MAG: hypothetical protein HRT35_33460, partial [Algicola sp.]|nr:hypothetical protein [Algicola sp.]